MKSYVYKTLISLIIVIFLLSGCATIMGKSNPESLSIKSNPEGAKVIIFDEEGNKIFEGRTPTIVSLKKKKGYFKGKKYTIKISKPGYKEYSINVETRLNGWYIGGNLIFGGLIGWLIVDPMTGAMWSLDTNKIDVKLIPQSNESKIDSYTLGILLLDEVPLSLRDKMVKLSQ